MSGTERLVTVPFALAFVANFFQGLALHCYLHIPGYLDTLGATPTQVGLIVGTMSGAAIAIRPVAGFLMDRRGRRVVILGGALVHVAVCALYLTVDRVGPWIYIVRVLQGFAEGAIFSSLFTYAADIIPASRRTEGMGIFGVSGMLPMAFGGLLGDRILAAGAYRDLFLATVVIATVALLLSVPLRESRDGAPEIASRGFVSAAVQPNLMPIWFVGSAFAAALAGLFAFLKNFVDSEAIGSVGLFFSFYAGAASLLRVLFGWVPDRVGPLKVFFPSMVCIALSLVALGFARDDLGIAIAGTLAGIGHGYVFPILSAIVVQRALPADRGSAVSLFTAVFDAGMLVGAPALGWIAETGSGAAADYRRMYLVAAALPVIGAAIFYGWDRRVRDS